ncbi:MAG: UDP-N-acetylmuramate dehydrogenase [Paludibacter sp.]|nr:UDP-N-acetylmuramate dehydrogenase [Paludibacter sp.]
MKITQNASLLSFNTFGINARTDYYIEYDSSSDLQTVLQLELVKSNKMLHIGSGSNLLFLTDFKGVILHSTIQSIEIVKEDDLHVYLEVGSSVVWDDFVAYTVKNSWGGVVNLSLIPGETGASAVQNIGAYGVEVCDVIVEVKTVDIETSQTRIFSNIECKYGYRDSIFKNELKGKYIITSVLFRLDKNPAFKLIYQHLEAEVLKNGEINLQTIRKTIIDIRESKLPDPKITGNAGSFFMNPIISKNHFKLLQEKYPLIPHYFVSDTEEKIPAGWLIEQCGWKGKRIGNAGVHEKQALVIVNLGGATGAEIVYLAEQIQASIKETFGIVLKAEVNYI